MLEERFTPGQPVQTLWPLADHLGTARVILDGAGLVLSRLTYDSFGNLVNVPAIVPTFTFTGRDYDERQRLPNCPAAHARQSCKADGPTRLLLRNFRHILFHNRHLRSEHI